MAQEPKKATTYQEQIDILKRHGCVIHDETYCVQKLTQVNYYRLSAYFLPFKQADGRYRDGTSFYTVYRIYEFDRKLRGILLSAVEEVEIFLRARFSYYHAHQYGPTGYLNPENYSPKHNAEKFQDTISREIESNKKVLFVKHHVENYEGIFPIWVITELFTFGMLSHFYSDLTRHDQKYLARELFGSIPKNVISWLRCCTDLRNICAHYGRLYYRVFPAVPAGFDIPDSAKRRLWGVILTLRALYPDQNKWNLEVLPAMEALFETYCDDINLYHLAFPENWAEQLQK